MTDIESLYGNRVRVRVCGLCWESGRLLMANHTIYGAEDFWAPPGGGVEFGEALSDTLQREFREETGLSVSCGAFQFGCEFIKPPLHGVELFFNATRIGGKLEAGDDPELAMISGVRFMEFDEIMALPTQNVHGLFRFCKTPHELAELRGFLRI